MWNAFYVQLPPRDPQRGLRIYGELKLVQNYAGIGSQLPRKSRFFASLSSPLQPEFQSPPRLIGPNGGGRRSPPPEQR